MQQLTSLDLGVSSKSKASLEPKRRSKLARASDGLGQVLAAWLVARVAVAVGFVVATVWQRVVTDGEAGDGVLRLEQGLLAWDGDWYRKIANEGYGGTEAEALRFFPLFPKLGGLVGSLFGGDSRLGLIVVANVAAVATLMAVHKLVSTETGDFAMARRAVWLTALFPSAFVLVWAYSESLFLLAAIWCFYALRRQLWAPAAVAGLFASLCRPLGVLLAIPAAIEVGRWWWSGRKAGASPADTNGIADGGAAAEAKSGPSWKQLLGGLAAIVSPVAGLAVFGLGIAATDNGAWNDPFGQQEQFRGEFVDPITRLIRGFQDLIGPEALGDGLHLPFAVAFIALAVVCGRKWPASYTAFAVAVLITALAADNINSLERYALTAFPLVFGLAAITKEPNRYLGTLAVSTLGLVGLTTLAWIGVYVP